MSTGDRWREEIAVEFMESAEVKRKTAEACGEGVLRAAEVIAGRLREGGKLLLCGNGGSAADAQHIAAELMGRLDSRIQRPGLPAIALTADTSVLTALGNDYGYDCVFQRQVEALAGPADVLLAISTSGRSPNLLRAVPEARARGAFTIGLTGEGSSPLGELVDLHLAVPSNNTQRIQEAHIAIGHVLCHLVEQMAAKDARKEALWSLP